MIQHGEYEQIVLVTDGNFEGEIGFFDNDEWNPDTKENEAIVYLGHPFNSDYIQVPHRLLRRASDDEMAQFYDESWTLP